MFNKALLTVIAGAGLAMSFGFLGSACVGAVAANRTPTPVPTSSTPVATATPTASTLLTNTLSVAWSAANYAAGFATTNAGSFTPVAGKAVTVTTVASVTNARISIDVNPAGVATGAGLYTTNGVPNTNTTILTFTPASSQQLIVCVANFNSINAVASTVTVTVTQ